MSPRRMLSATAALGAAGLAAVAVLSPAKFWATLLIMGFFPLSLSLGAGVFLAIDQVTGARWSAPLRPLASAMARCYWPSVAAVLLAVGLGWTDLFGWVRETSHGHVAHAQQVWLSPSFMLARAVGYALIWGFLLPRIRSQASAALYLAAFGVTVSLAGFDWFMALEPAWVSTLFGVYVFAGLFLGALAALCIGAVLLGSPGPHLEDLGKLLFGFSMFWAYIWYCQYMLIWYTNLPEEITYYLRRHDGGWAVLSLTSVALNWVIPFCVLLPRWTKAEPKVLLRVGLVVLAGRWLDLYIMAMPRFAGARPSIGPWEALVFLGAAAGFAGLVLRRLDAGAAARA